MLYYDGVLYLCLVVLVMVGVWLVLHGVGILSYWWGCRKVDKFNNAGPQEILNKVK